MRRFAAVLLALTVAGCEARGQSETTPSRPQPFTVVATPVAPTSADGAVGALRFAGGFEMRAVGTSLFGGLSGIDAAEDGAVLMVTDAGDLVRGRLLLDQAGRLAGVTDLTIEALKDEGGAPLSRDQSQADVEDVTFLPGGGFAVSLERNHRVLANPARGQRAVRRVDLRRTRFEPKADVAGNTGFEGLAATPDGLVLGAEKGRLYRCLDDRSCRERPVRRPGFGWDLTALDALGESGALVSTWRMFPLWTGGAWVSAIHGPDGRELARLDGPLGGNVEGIAAVRRGEGWRLYVVADDGFGESGRSLLLAFDWTPAPRLR